MKDELTKLRAEIEELEKNLSTVTSANATFAELSAMRIYLENVQKFIISLTNAFDQHQISCQEYSTQIQSLQEQINQINTKLEQGTSVNLDEVNLKIDTLTFNLDQALAKIDTLKGGSDNTIAQLTRDVSDLQSEVGYINDEIEAINTEISTINTYIGDLQTQVNNLSSTQNTLTTAQSSLSSRVSGIDNRLTTAEANISTLTGGVDVAYLDERITNVEKSKTTHTVVTEKYRMYLNLTNQTPLYSLFYYYKTDYSEYIEQKFVLNYVSNGDGILTINLLQNNIITKNIEVDLSKHPDQFEINCSYCPTQNYQSFQFYFSTTSTETINFNYLTTTIYGNNPILFVTDQDLKFMCYENSIYTTIYHNNQIKIAVQNKDSFVINGDELGTYKLISSIQNKRCATFGVKRDVYNEEGYTLGGCTVFTENPVNNKIYHHNLTIDSLEFKNDKHGTSAFMYSGIISFDTYNFGCGGVIHNNLPAFFRCSLYSETPMEHKYLNKLKPGNWYLCVPIRCNFHSSTSLDLLRSYPNIQTIGFHEDGNMYLITDEYATSVDLIGEGGKHATAYYQPDGSITVYINKFNYTNKYVITLDEKGEYSCTFVEKILDCDCVYEIFDTHLVKHTPAGWTLEQIANPEITE